MAAENSERDDVQKSREVFIEIARKLDKQMDNVMREIDERQTILGYLGNAKQLADSTANDLQNIMPNSGVALSMKNLGLSGAAMLESASTPYLGSDLSASKLFFNQMASNCSNVAYEVGQVIKIEAFPETTQLLGVLHIELKPLVERLVETVQELHPDATQRALALKSNLADATNPHRFSDAGTNLREMLRMLYYLKAPDELIEKWAELEVDENRGRPTILSRLRYSIFRNLNPNIYPAGFLERAELAAENAKKTYSLLNGYTHRTNEQPLSQDEAIPELHRAVDNVLQWIETFKAAVKAREDIIYELVDQEISNIVTNDLHPEIEEHYSHAYINSVDTNEVVIEREDGESSYFCGSGSVSFTGQMGSDGDVRRGEGLEMDCNRRFKFTGRWIHGEHPELEISDSDVELEPEYPGEYEEEGVEDLE